MAVHFYSSLFRSDEEATRVFPTGLFPPISTEMYSGLATDYSINEAKMALKGMGSSKVPCPNGFNPGFFKHTWDVMGSAIYAFAQDILVGKEISEEAASALLILIPKGTTHLQSKFFGLQVCVMLV